MSKITSCEVVSPSTVQAGTGGWPLTMKVRIINNDVVEHTVTFQVLVDGQVFTNRTVKVLPGGSLSAKVDKFQVQMPDPNLDSRLPTSGSFTVETKIVKDQSAVQGVQKTIGNLLGAPAVSRDGSLGARAGKALAGASSVPEARRLVHADALPAIEG